MINSEFILRNLRIAKITKTEFLENDIIFINDGDTIVMPVFDAYKALYIMFEQERVWSAPSLFIYAIYDHREINKMKIENFGEDVYLRVDIMYLANLFMRHQSSFVCICRTFLLKQLD